MHEKNNSYSGMERRMLRRIAQDVVVMFYRITRCATESWTGYRDPARDPLIRPVCHGFAALFFTEGGSQASWKHGAWP